MRLNALWWWIDRWRKSTAYTDFTLEEQGAYRNLLDEAQLRGGALPDDERVLAKACGDALAWERVRPRVMARFVKRDDGWHNETLDEVIRESARRATKQKNYRNRTGNGGGNVSGGGNDSGNGGSNAGGSPSPSPDPSLDQTPEPSPSEAIDQASLPRTATAEQRRSYFLAVWEAFVERRGGTDMENPSSAEVDLVNRWFDKRVALRWVLTAIKQAVCKERPRSLLYFEPVVAEEVERVRKALAL